MNFSDLVVIAPNIDVEWEQPEVVDELALDVILVQSLIVIGHKSLLSCLDRIFRVIIKLICLLQRF